MMIWSLIITLIIIITLISIMSFLRTYLTCNTKNNYILKAIQQTIQS